MIMTHNAYPAKNSNKTIEYLESIEKAKLFSESQIQLAVSLSTILSQMCLLSELTISPRTTSLIINDLLGISINEVMYKLMLGNLD